MHDIVLQFQNHFEIVSMDEENILHQCQKIRYQVFCLEQQIFDEEVALDEREFDVYDDRSVHTLLRHRHSGECVATVRLVLPGIDSQLSIYPMEEQVKNFSEHDKALIRNIPHTRLAEISRFSVTKRFRRREGELNLSHGVSKQFGKLDNDKAHSRRFDAHITLGLFKAIVKMSDQNEIDHWFAFMEPGLIRLLRRVGIVFHRVGPVINYCGIRHACYAEVRQVLMGVKQARPDIWSFITEKGTLGISHCEESSLC